MTYVTIEQMAEQIDVPKEYFRKQVTKRADFPRPSLVLSSKVKKWSALDFEVWLKKQRDKWAK